MKLESLLWMLPVLFMLHDFEEIIMGRPWIAHHRVALRARFPALAGRLLPHLESLSTSAFALAVAEEFLILVALTWLCVEFDLYNLWAAILLAFTFHLLIHLIQALIFRGYTPALITSVLGLPVGLSLFVNLSARVGLSPASVLLWALFALVLLVANLILVHRMAARFDRFLASRFPT